MLTEQLISGPEYFMTWCYKLDNGSNNIPWDKVVPSSWFEILIVHGVTYRDFIEKRVV